MNLRLGLARLASLARLGSRGWRTAGWERYFQAGMTAHSEGRTQDAETAYRAALRMANGFDEDDPRLAVSLGSLSALYRSQGKHAQAEPICLRALEIKVKRLGPDHPDIAATLGDLAEILRAQGRVGEAEATHRRALAILEKAVGPDLPELIQSVENSIAKLRKIDR